MTHSVLPFPFEPEKTLVDGRFLIKGELGQGGMGRCYRVWQESLDRLCVLKMLAPKLHPHFLPERDARVLLENEAKTLGLLAAGNDSCVQVFDRGVLYIRVRQDSEVFELDLPYYVMEFLSGYSLEALIDRHQRREQPLAWDVVVSLCAQMARALAIAHERGVIHRDLKPDNIFLHMRVGGLYIIKLIDFGVSTREGSASLFGTGTARYGAPEILSRTAPRESTQSDMYPLGLVFFELAALRGPFMGRMKADFLRAHVRETPPRLSQLRGDCPAFFDALCARLLAKDPRDRPTAKEVAERLEAELTLRGRAKETDVELAQLLHAINPQAVRQGAASRDLSAPRSGRAATTGSAESLVDPERMSALYLTRAPSAALVDRRTVPVGPGAPVLRGQTLPMAAVVPPRARAAERDVGLEAVSVTEPIVLSAPAGAAAGGAAPPIAMVHDTAPDPQPLFANPPPPDAGSIDDVADVPVFRSMAHVFEAVWEDDDKYMPSPLGTGEYAVRRPNSSLSAVAIGGGAFPGERAPTPSAPPSSGAHTKPRGPAVRSRRLLFAGYGAVAAATALVLGAAVASRSRAAAVATGPTTETRVENVASSAPVRVLRSVSDLSVSAADPPAAPAARAKPAEAMVAATATRAESLPVTARPTSAPASSGVVPGWALAPAAPHETQRRAPSRLSPAAFVGRSEEPRKDIDDPFLAHPVVADKSARPLVDAGPADEFKTTFQ